MKRTPFHGSVADEAISKTKGEAGHEFARFIRLPANIDDWYQALIDLKFDVEQQLGDRKADIDRVHYECRKMGEDGKDIYFEKKMEHDAWRRGSTRFKKAIEYRLGEIRRLRRDAGDERQEAYRSLVRWAAELIPEDGDGAAWHEKAKNYLSL